LDNSKMRRVTFYLDQQEYRDLRVILASQGVSASEWLRGVIYGYVREKGETVSLPTLKNKRIWNKNTNQPIIPKGFNERDLL
jgi:hypothetical protein